MNIMFYENCRQFLEKMIEASPENQELIKAYTTLISKVADIEVKYSEHNTEFNKTYANNQADLTKNHQTTQAEITKKQIDKGPMPVPQQFNPGMPNL